MKGGAALESSTDRLTAQEIAVNKLTTLVSRSELRDLVDLMLLERSGCSVEAALPKALQKDGGCTPATLAWVLSEIRIPDGEPLPGRVAPLELRAFLSSLIETALRLAAPAPKDPQA